MRECTFKPNITRHPNRDINRDLHGQPPEIIQESQYHQNEGYYEQEDDYNEMPLQACLESEPAQEQYLPTHIDSLNPEHPDNLDE